MRVRALEASQNLSEYGGHRAVSGEAGVQLVRYWLESEWNCPPRASSEELR